MPIDIIVISKQLSWINVENPTAEDLAHLKEQFGFHELALDDCVSEIQRPKIDSYPDYLFVVLHFPRFDHARRRIMTEEVKMFIGRSYLVTVHNGRLKPMNILVAELSIKKNQNDYKDRSSAHLFYHIVDRLVDYCFPILDKTSINLAKLEEEIFEQPSGHSVRMVTIIRRNILNFRKIIEPERKLISTLEHKHHAIFPTQLDIFFDDILDHIETIWQTLENQLEIVEGLSSTNENLLSFRTNEIIKVLTLISVIILPLSLISGMWGMNMHLPFAQHEYSFLIIFGIMLTIVIVMVGLFKRQKWI